MNLLSLLTLLSLLAILSVYGENRTNVYPSGTVGSLTPIPTPQHSPAQVVVYESSEESPSSIPSAYTTTVRSCRESAASKPAVVGQRAQSVFNFTCDEDTGHFVSNNPEVRIERNETLSLPTASLYVAKLVLGRSSSLNMTLDDVDSHSFISIDDCFHPQGRMIVHVNFVPSVPTMLVLIRWNNNDSECDSSSIAKRALNLTESESGSESGSGSSGTTTNSEFDYVTILDSSSGCTTIETTPEYGIRSFGVLLTPVNHCSEQKQDGFNTKLVVGVVVGVVGGLLVVVVFGVILGFMVWKFVVTKRRSSFKKNVINV